MLITSTVIKPFKRICLDIIGPLSQTSLGNTNILKIQDELVLSSEIIIGIIFFVMQRLFIILQYTHIIHLCLTNLF